MIYRHGHTLEDEWICEECRKDRDIIESMLRGGETNMGKKTIWWIIGIAVVIFVALALWMRVPKAEATSVHIPPVCEYGLVCPAGFTVNPHQNDEKDCYKAVDKMECPSHDTDYTSLDSTKACHRDWNVPGDGKNYDVRRWADKVKTGTDYEHAWLVCADAPPVIVQPVCTGACGDPPTFAGSSTNPPVCSDGNTTQLVANLHVIRKGSEATVNFFITQGDSANIYYKVVGESNWQYSVADVKPNGDKFVGYTIGGLNPALGYEFGVQQKTGCAGGQIATAVVVDGPANKVFGFSYWIW